MTASLGKEQVVLSGWNGREQMPKLAPNDLVWLSEILSALEVTDCIPASYVWNPR
jgi:hypothetical protein